MRTKRVFLALAVLAVIAAGTFALAKQPPPPPPAPNCNRVVCAQCPEGYVLQKGNWPDCCTCVPAP